MCVPLSPFAVPLSAVVLETFAERFSSLTVVRSLTSAEKAELLDLCKCFHQVSQVASFVIVDESDRKPISGGCLFFDPWGFINRSAQNLLFSYLSVSDCAIIPWPCLLVMVVYAVL